MLYTDVAACNNVTKAEAYWAINTLIYDNYKNVT